MTSRSTTLIQAAIVFGVVAPILIIAGFFIEDFWFYVFSAMALISAWLMVYTSKVMRSAIYFIFFVSAVAAIFLFANSEILFGLQLSIYGGGIVILFLFAVTLIEQEYFELNVREALLPTLISVLFALNIFLMVFSPPAQISNSLAARDDPFGVVTEFSVQMWTVYTHVLPFVALLLLAALLGSVRLVLRNQPSEEEVMY